MLQPYREAGTRVEVIEHRPLSTLGELALLALQVTVIGLLLFQMLAHARSARLECTRGGANACVIVRAYGPVKFRTAVPIHYITAVRVTAHHRKRSVLYGAAFEVHHDELVALIRPTTRGHAELVASGAEALALRDPPGTTAMPLEDPDGTLAALYGAGALVLAGIWLLRDRGARLEFDLERRTIKYSLLRWPRRAVHRTLRVDDVTHASAVALASGKGAKYVTVLAVRGGDDLRLTPQGGGNASRNEETAAKINAILVKLRDEPNS